MAVSPPWETSYSMENVRCGKPEEEMKRLYRQESSMALELSHMVRQLELDRPLDEGMAGNSADHAVKGDIVVFSQIFYITEGWEGEET